MGSEKDMDCVSASHIGKKRGKKSSRHLLMLMDILEYFFLYRLFFSEAMLNMHSHRSNMNNILVIGALVRACLAVVSPTLSDCGDQAEQYEERDLTSELVLTSEFRLYCVFLTPCLTSKSEFHFLSPSAS